MKKRPILNTFLASLGFLILGSLENLVHSLEVPKNNKEWSQQIATFVSRHFNKEYKDDKRVFHIRRERSANIIKRSIAGKQYLVHRKRHGLAHGVRQGFLAVDIIHCLSNMPSSFFGYWAKNKLENDANFLKKIELMASFQRSGRESEASFNEYPELHTQYERQDALNFEHTAKKYIGTLFKDSDEVQLFKEALLNQTKNESLIDEKENTDLFYLRKITTISHMLDLRRVPSFDAKMIKNIVSQSMFHQDYQAGSLESFYVDKLWDQTGSYLRATGDRDMVSQKKNFSNHFFVLSNHPKKLIHALYQARL